MKTTHVIYGAIDDLVEVDGPHGDEFENEGIGGPTFVNFIPSGDVFCVVLDKLGIWRVSHHIVSGQLAVENDALPPDASLDEPRYTDRMTVIGEVTRIEAWRSWPPDIAELRRRIERHVENEKLRELSRDQLAAVLAILQTPESSE